MMRIGFAQANADDIEALVTLRIAAMRESLERIGRFDSQRARERFLSRFEPAITQHIVVDGVRVGFVGVRPHDAHTREIVYFYIDPAQQQRGIGTAVLKRVLDDADRDGMDLRVDALRESSANAFYQRHGFVQIAESEFDISYLRRK